MRPSVLRDSGERDALLVLLAIASGAVDALSWLALGKIFSAFMTGNIAFLGFALGGADAPPIGRTAIALLAFGAGAAVAARIVAPARESRVWPRHVTAALIPVVVLEALFAALWVAAGPGPSASVQDVLIAVSSLAMGIQTYAVLSLGVRASFTTAATATWTVLLGDVGRPGADGSRDEVRRLTGVIAGLALGAALGAYLTTCHHAWAPVLPVAITALVTLLAWWRFAT
jgi:uncharacterized membrane protein YoaK (UPF0700 family)